MDLSVVLWNCDGKMGNRKERVNSIESTMTSWMEKNEVPTVVLAQELEGSVLNKWNELSAESDAPYDCEAACFYPEQPDAREPDIEFLVVELARIQCSIMKIRGEKILICSWHGENKPVENEKIEQLKEMLNFVDEIKEDNNCCFALVGGDYNLVSRKAKRRISMFLKSRNGVLHDAYDMNSSLHRARLIDYVIYWPSDRVEQNGATLIDTHPEQDEEKRMFDHPLIQYNFRVLLKWKGEGEMTAMYSNRGGLELNDKEYEGQDFNDFCEGVRKLGISGHGS